MVCNSCSKRAMSKGGGDRQLFCAAVQSMKGGPSKPPCRRRLQTTFRRCSPMGVVVNGEGKGSEVYRVK